jgi:hypothetical protein
MKERAPRCWARSQARMEGGMAWGCSMACGRGGGGVFVEEGRGLRMWLGGRVAWLYACGPVLGVGC